MQREFLGSSHVRFSNLVSGIAVSGIAVLTFARTQHF